MRKLYKEMLGVAPLLPATETLVSRKLKTKKHHFFLYYDRINKEVHFAIELTKKAPPQVSLPKCKGFNLHWDTLPFMSGSNRALILSCPSIINEEFFLRVSDDLKNILQHVTDEEQMILKAIGRISLWQDFFKKYGESTMSTEKQKGLYGELCSIQTLNTVMPLNEIIPLWNGPFKDPHDFNLVPFHLETKTTTKKESASITIHGVDQLTPPKDKELFLHTVVISTSGITGESLIDVVNRLDSKLRTEPDILEKFHSRLMSYGYPIGGFDNPLYFEVEDEYFYHVKEGFPRYERINGIPRVEYDIELLSVESFKIDKEEMLKYYKKTNKAV